MKMTIKAGYGSTKISFAQAKLIFGKDYDKVISEGERRGEIKTRGPWSIISSYRSLCITSTWKDVGYSKYVDEYTIYGDRQLSNPRQSGYDLEGYVSVEGKKLSAFTSSILFELPDGILIDVGCIHARTPKN